MDLALFFACITAFAVVVYVLADGFDLGIGILFLLAPRDSDRDLMMQTIEPVWDGNETWLVMGGLLLYVGFPAGYYILMPAFYLPVMLMLFALIFRGIAFTFRFQVAGHRRIWDWAFALGSLFAAFAQGLILGGIVQGVPVTAGRLCRRAVHFPRRRGRAVRPRPRCGLCAARRRLAGLEDERRDADLRTRGPAAPRWSSRR